VRSARNRFTVPAALAAAAVALVLTAGCGREESPDLSNGKSQFVQQCGSCHALARAGTQGETGPDLDEAFLAALQDGMDRDTVEGIVHDQIGNVRRGSEMPEDLVTGDDARDVAAYVAYAAGKKGEDGGALAQAGLAGATTGEQIFTAAGCGSCHTLGKAGTSATTGPSLDDLASEAGERQPGVSAEEYVQQSLTDPDAFRAPGTTGQMPSFEGRLTEEQIQALTQYLLGD
jgi:mono/diheme cytochrome c family protein